MRHEDAGARGNRHARAFPRGGARATRIARLTPAGGVADSSAFVARPTGPYEQAVEVLLLQIEAGCRSVNKQSTVGSRQPTLCKAGASSYHQHLAFGAKQT